MAIYSDTGIDSGVPNPYRAAVLVPGNPRAGLMPDSPDEADRQNFIDTMANLDGRYKSRGTTTWEPSYPGPSAPEENPT